ncbi:S8 family serine peptidase [Kocuria flava]|uniref:S8 family serine peptidase n=1 Tax=Kocuria flava TaxID=446860 RepID=UPI003F192DC9
MLEPNRPTGGTPPPQPGTTGRWVLVLDPGLDDPRPALRAAGLTRSAPGTEVLGGTGGGEDVEALLFPELHMAVVACERSRLAPLLGPPIEHPPVLAVAPELVHRVLAGHPAPEQDGYVAGYRDGVADLGARLLGRTVPPAPPGPPGQPPPGTPPSEPSPPVPLPPVFRDDHASTWGLQAVQAVGSPFTGAGVRVAVLDTGLDLGHPDVAGREVTARSFVPGESAQDGHGHGTHCAGTVAGPAAPAEGPRYGTAPGAVLFAGKVLADDGSGADAQVLAGIEWALANRCDIVSLSLGSDVREVSPTYTAAGLRALDRGTLLVAAAGNNADRVNGDPGFVGAPANSPHVMAVGALTHQLDPAFFSARSLPVRGGHVDLAAPGLEVRSAWPMPERHRTISGTSMAAPHAAGVAALWAEATGRRGRELWAVLVQEAHRLAAPSVDVGSGLVVAPR